jgi:hypothetical protein
MWDTLNAGADRCADQTPKLQKAQQCSACRWPIILPVSAQRGFAGKDPSRYAVAQGKPASCQHWGQCWYRPAQRAMEVGGGTGIDALSQILGAIRQRFQTLGGGWSNFVCRCASAGTGRVQGNSVRILSAAADSGAGNKLLRGIIRCSGTRSDRAKLASAQAPRHQS